MIQIPAGPFVSGCIAGQPRCTVTSTTEIVLDTYYMSETEVTEGAYGACSDAGVCAPLGRAGSQFCGAGWTLGPDFPATCLFVQDAADYCTWIGARLPTEAEWEKAARGPFDTRPYPWGDTPPTCSEAIGNMCGGTALVGTASAGASPYGLLDMSGNLWEFVDTPTTAGLVVTRGGSSQQGAPRLTVYERRAQTQDMYPFFNNGFRCAWP
ncbi:MAG: SUMF1/EgtB/PvdO family nonheme iron enzyme [Deltaproteobacteria bacterium]